MIQSDAKLQILGLIAELNGTFDEAFFRLHASCEAMAAELRREVTSRSPLIAAMPVHVSNRRALEEGSQIDAEAQGRGEFAGFLGAMNRYQVDIGDAILQAYAGAGARHKVGDRVALDFPFRDAAVLAE